MAPNSSAKLSAGAQAFKPNGKTAPTPIKILNRDSTADDYPVIVTSPMPATNGSVDGGSNNGQKAAQQPIGTRNGKVSPSRPLIFFTTDIGENVPFQGGHYVKVDNITKADLDITFRYLNEDVSLLFRSQVQECSLTRVPVRLAEQNPRCQRQVRQ